MSHVLIVDDEPNMRRVLGALLENAGHSTGRASSGEEALALVRIQDPDVVLTDLRMEGLDGMALLGRLRAEFPEIPVVMLTAHGSIDVAVEAMKRGAFDFLAKPFDRDRVLEVVGKALGQAEGRRADFQGPLDARDPCGMIGASAAMQAVRKLVQRVAASPATVLVTGETGTGKELVASALHEMSPRKKAAFVCINCGALPDNLVESELFGYEKGAFSGADRGKPGRFELADGGTLFLDEVGELPLASQVKLLRVLQDGVIDPLGSTTSRKIDVRLVAATNRDLEVAAKEGRFREDLLYRLRVVEIRVPALRDRLDDVPALVEFFLDKHAQRLGRRRPRVGTSGLAALQARAWPGNVRELDHAVERAVLLAEGDELGPTDFGFPAAPAVAEHASPSGSLRAATDEAHRQVITAALDETGGNVTRAAEKLGLSRRGLQLKIKELALR